MRTRFTRALAAAVLAGLFVTTPLFAADETDADAQIQQMTVELKELDVADERNAATAELGQVEALVAKARSIVGERREREVLQRTIEEAEATLSLAEGKMVEAEKEAMLEEQKEKLAETESELQSTRNRVDELEQEQAKLDAKLGGGK